jgi:hypothetical protein
VEQDVAEPDQDRPDKAVVSLALTEMLRFSTGCQAAIRSNASEFRAK